MIERLRPGEALAAKGREIEANRAKWAKLSNARRNELARKGLVGGEHTAAQLVELRDRRLAETRERHPEWFGAAA